MTEKRLWVQVKSYNVTDGVTLELDPTFSHLYVPEHFINLAPRYLKYIDGEVYEKNEEEKRIIDLPLKYRYLEGNNWREKTAEDKQIADDEEESAWQTNKSINLKIMENIYFSFLQDQWTPLLRTNGIISPTAEVTIENTDELQNITYLIALRNVSFESYSLMAGEFQRLKDQILRLGGIMAKIKHHNLN